MTENTPSPLGIVISIDGERIKSHLDRVVRDTGGYRGGARGVRRTPTAIRRGSRPAGGATSAAHCRSSCRDRIHVRLPPRARSAPPARVCCM